MKSGELCVIMDGINGMPKLCAVNWEFMSTIQKSRLSAAVVLERVEAPYGWATSNAMVKQKYRYMKQFALSN